MRDDWKEFLRRQGAHYTDEEVRDFGDSTSERRALRGGNVLVDLSHLSLIRAGGADVTTFLNGQLTSDVSRLAPGRSELSAWCSPKGRMVALFRVLRHGDAFLLQLPASLRGDVIKRLRMYVLRAKVVLENADDMFVRFGVAGPRAANLVQAAIGTAPANDNEVLTRDGLLLTRLPGAHPRFEFLAPPAQAPELWEELKRDALPAGADAWTWHDIAAGIPAVLPETSDAFVPQMANLELLGGVSFTKGCYIGQEIVARLHYRGRLKQRMYRAHVESETMPRPGAPLYAEAAPAQPSGTVVVAAPAPERGHDLLAVIYCDRAESGGLRLGSINGPPLRIDPLPYALNLPQ